MSIIVTEERIDVNDSNIIVPISCDGKLYGFSESILSSRKTCCQYIKYLHKGKKLKINKYFEFNYAETVRFFLLPIKESHLTKPNPLGVKYALNNILNIIDKYDLKEIHTPCIGIEPNSGDFLQQFLDITRHLKNSECKIYLHLPQIQNYIQNGNCQI